MPVNITIPTAIMITCDGDQFPVGIIIEAQNSSNQPGKYHNTYFTFPFHIPTSFDQRIYLKEAFSETMLFIVLELQTQIVFVSLIRGLINDSIVMASIS